jgi:hypothetical protein
MLGKSFKTLPETLEFILHAVHVDTKVKFS